MPEESSLQDRVVRLEELFSHHQHTVQQLSDVILRLRDEVETLARRVDRHEARLQLLSEKQAAIEEQPDEKLPHY